MTKKEAKSPEQFSADPAAIELLHRAETLGLSTAFTRAESMAACPIGSRGMCCSMCLMGPCRITKDGQVGVCGATLETIGARIFARHVAAGSAAHSDHGRDLAFTLKAVAKGEAKGFKIRDPFKLQDGGGAPGHHDRGPPDPRHRQRRRRQGDCRVRPAEGRACLSAPAPKKR